VRAVLDVNILIAALLSPAGAPAHIVSRWLAGDFELVVSEKLLAELERTLSYSKLRSRVSATDATAFIKLLRNSAIMAADREAPPSRSVDPADDYLLALAESERAILVLRRAPARARRRAPGPNRPHLSREPRALDDPPTQVVNG
jgi:uncharacterized protein